MEPTLELSCKAFALSLRIDSSETVYHLDFQALDPAYASIGSRLKERILNKKASDACLAGLENLPEEQSLEFQRALYAASLLFKRHQGSDISAEEAEGVDLGSLICRCAGLDRHALEKAFMQAKGDFNQTILDTNASMLCSHCEGDVRELYNSMTFEEVERRRERARLAVSQALEEFALFCPPEYDQMKFSVASVKNDVIKIKVEGERKGVGRKEILKTLENFLPKEPLEGMRLSVFF